MKPPLIPSIKRASLIVQILQNVQVEKNQVAPKIGCPSNLNHHVRYQIKLTGLGICVE